MTQAGAEVVHSCEPISVERRIHRLSTILEPPPEASCEDAVTTVEMMACVRHDLAAAEARMEALLEDLSEADDEGLRLLTAAQDAWGAYVRGDVTGEPIWREGAQWRLCCARDV